MCILKEKNVIKHFYVRNYISFLDRNKAMEVTFWKTGMEGKEGERRSCSQGPQLSFRTIQMRR